MSPQHHLVFDDEFTTIQYLSSTDIPPQWLALVKNSSDKTPKGDYTLAETWFNHTSEEESENKEPIIQTYDSESTQPNKMLLDSEGDSNKSSKPTTVSKEETSENLETSDVKSTVIPNNFINIETTGLRRSPRNHKSGKLSPNCFLMRIKNKGMMYMTNKFVLVVVEVVPPLFFPLPVVLFFPSSSQSWS